MKINSNGEVIARKLIIDADWVDYVFEDWHKRMNWKEKEKFYNLKKHLPGIAPAKQIEKEGLKVGETMTGITLNVEENRLDITDLYKMYLKHDNEIKELKKSNEEKDKKIESLEKENIEKLKK